MNAERLNLFLIGYRCTGKSTVGKLLAEKLSRSFVDTDSLLVAQQQMSIKEIVGAHGWEGFRQMEYLILKNICTLDGQVVATGGGSILNDDNVILMQKSVLSLESSKSDKKNVLIFSIGLVSSFK